MVGSGVILCALHKNKVYYLFGKEGSMERDKKCHWGDFGGGSKTGEDLLDTTTREGAEELNGFFGSKPFSQIDQALTANGSDPINWQIPN